MNQTWNELKWISIIPGRSLIRYHNSQNSHSIGQFWPQHLYLMCVYPYIYIYIYIHNIYIYIYNIYIYYTPPNIQMAWLERMWPSPLRPAMVVSQPVKLPSLEGRDTRDTLAGRSSKNDGWTVEAWKIWEISEDGWFNGGLSMKKMWTTTVVV